MDISTPDQFTKATYRSLEREIEDLYNLFHSKYILTWDGMFSIKLKLKTCVFGNCPRIYCNGQKLLPVGLDDDVRKSSVKCFCPKCQDIYHPYPVIFRKIDGAAFGTTFPHLLMLQFPELKVNTASKKYTTKVFGFKIQ